MHVCNYVADMIFTEASPLNTQVEISVAFGNVGNITLITKTSQEKGELAFIWGMFSSYLNCSIFYQNMRELHAKGFKLHLVQVVVTTILHETIEMS